MNLEEAKFEISQKILQLRKKLQYRNVKILRDEELQKDVCFNGWMTIEGFCNEIEFELYLDLDSLIHLCYLNELNEEKRNLLVESIVTSLTFDNHISTNQYKEVFEKLTADQLSDLKLFEEEQERLKNVLIENLTEKYLSGITLDKSKIARLIWKGSQLQLAELFLQLQNKGWLNIGSNKNAFYRTVATVFEVPGSNSLFDNIKDYFTKSKISPYGIFRSIHPNDIK
jgi:hypothetical protein